MPDSNRVERWIERFPIIETFSGSHLQMARGTVHFPVLEAGAVAYELDDECANYLMCIDGLTRVFRTSEGGREMLIHKVGAGGTCVLTTQCLLAGGGFPAESIAEKRTELAAIPSTTFRQLMAESPGFRSFVLDDYTKLMASMFALVEEIAFAPLEKRLARRLLVEADPKGIVAKTHQQLATDVGSVREVISRILAQWAEAGLVALRRGEIELTDRLALSSSQFR